MTHIVLDPDLIAEYPQRRVVVKNAKPSRRTTLMMKPERWKPDSAPRKLSRERKFSFVMDNGESIDFCLCPAGTFIMSNVPGQNKQTHRVKLTYPFLISKYNVTAAQWRDFGRFDCEGVPRELEKLFDREIKKDKWNICVRRNYWQWTQFCKHLTEHYRTILPDGYVFRLPTEAEQEWAMLADGKGTAANLDNARYDKTYRDTLVRLMDKKKLVMSQSLVRRMRIAV